MKGLPYLEYAYQSDTSNFVAIANLANYFIDIRPFTQSVATKALQYLEKAHQKEPDDIDILLKLAKVYKSLKNLEKANEFYESVHKVKQDEVTANQNLAQHYHKKKEYNKAAMHGRLAQKAAK